MNNPAIIQFVPSLKPTGPVSVALELATLFRKKGCRVKFWYVDDLPGAVPEDAQKVSILGGLPSTSGFDIIHAHGLRPDLALWLNRNKLNIPVFNTIHTYIDHDFASRYGRATSVLAAALWKKLMVHQNAHVVLQSHMQKYYADNWQLEKTHVIPNTRQPAAIARNAAVVDKLQALSSTYKLIISAGEAIELKGLEDIAAALPHLPNFAWVHFGDGPLLPNTKENISLQNLSNRVWLPGYVAGASAYFTLGNVFVMPSRVEGFPLALLEAVASGIPAVTSHLPVFQAIFMAEEVQQIDTKNSIDFAKAIEKAAENANAFAANALNRYNIDYQPGVVADKYLYLMKKLIANGR